MKMTKSKRARYTLEYKQEAVRLVESGKTIAAVARSLGMVDQTLFNWVMDNEQSVRAAAPALVPVAEENLFPQPGEVPPVPALAPVAAPALPCRIQSLGAAGAEQ